MTNVALTVNGERREADVEPRQLLVYFLRDQLGLKGTNVGCDTSSCGACTVLVDGESGTVGSTQAVLNAVIDALAPHGVRDVDLPCNGENVWKALREARG